MVLRIWLNYLIVIFLFLVQTSAFAAPANDTLRVLTLNVFAGTQEMDFKRLKQQIEAVRDLNPDVIALQEVFDAQAKAHYQEAFNDYQSFESGKIKLPSSVSHKIVRIMQGSFELANKAFNLAPWSKGSRAILEGDSHGLMILLNKKKGIGHEHTKLVKIYQVQAAPSTATKLLETVKPRAFIWVEYEVNGIRVLVVNTHLSNGVQNKRRLGQLKQLVTEIAQRDIGSTNQACPVIFCGDTNADGNEPEMKWLHQDGGFRDSYLEKNPDLNAAPHRGMTWDNANLLTRGHLTEPDQRVDYVSMRGSEQYDFELLDSKLVLNTVPLSDHYGVLTELRIVPTCEKLLRTSKK